MPVEMLCRLAILPIICMFPAGSLATEYSIFLVNPQLETHANLPL